MAKKEVESVKSAVIDTQGVDAKEGIVKQLEEELQSVVGLREFVNKGANALAARLLGGQSLYTDNMVEILRKRLTVAWEQSRVLGEYMTELQNAREMFTRQIMAEKPIVPEVVS